MSVILRDFEPLSGVLIKRYKRFFADVRLDDGDVVTAICANTGTMKTCCEPGRPVILSESPNPDRKYRLTWELIQMGESWVNVNTGLPNGATAALLERGAVAGLPSYPYIRREVKFGKDGKSRIDLLLTNTPPPKKRKRDADPLPLCAPNDLPDMHVEIKNTSMRDGSHSVFPDAVTERGQKHLRELTLLAKRGLPAAMLFFCGRTDTEAFRPADEIDPEYGKLLRKAAKAGVLVLPYQVECLPREVRLVKMLPVEL